MGTQQIIADRFSQARDYEARWNEWNKGGDGIPPRRDLRMEALVDILNGDILVQSHSYRQDGILALMRLAESFDFSIKTFHHAVEAYKVAPELAEHGAELRYGQTGRRLRSKLTTAPSTTPDCSAKPAYLPHSIQTTARLPRA